MSKVNEKVIEYIREIPPPFRIIVEHLRALLFKVGEDSNITETLQNGVPVYKIQAKAYFFIEKQPKEHIKFGILAEPQKKYKKDLDANVIKIQSKEDIKTFGIAELIKETINNR
ncbi:MAG: DUF1801 domain-containing protein [Promethearchaeia archaeon]